jgi:gliding motility-associated-like protein
MHLRTALYRNLLLLILICTGSSGIAQYNTSGGELSYRFLYQDGTEFIKNHYKITLKLYKECSETGELPMNVQFFNAQANPGNVQPPYYPGVRIGSASMSNFYITMQNQSLCMDNFPPICYQVGVYTIDDLPLDLLWGDHFIYIQDDRRKPTSFVNVNTDGIGKKSGGVMGFTYTCRIPGMLGVGFVNQPSSPVFKKEYPLILCAGQPFRYDFSAQDPDGDSLAYQFANSYQGMIYTTPRYPTTASDPPFLSLQYTPGFSGNSPFGSNVSIDPNSGVISGTAPPKAGRYMVVVEVLKYRNGELVTKHRKDIQFIFNNCSTGARAQLDSTYRNCKGTTINFQNFSTGQIQKYFWDFGDLSTTRDTSNLAEPSYTYPGPGIYTVKMYINKGTTLCKDSATATVIVDTGMNASFTALRDISVCNQALYNFTSTSTQGSNPITSYAWDFGEASDPNDNSSSPNDSYLYPTEGNKLVRLIIRNGIGCSDTAFKNLIAFKSLMRAPADTTICHLDTITLQTNTNGYPGTFAWSPNYNINSLSSAAPLVYPKKDTAYIVSFTDGTGCIAIDTVKIKVRDTVNIRIKNIDTTICKFDTVFVSAIHDGKTVTWSPNSNIFQLNSDGSSIWTYPRSTVDLIATAHFGSCVARDTVNLKVVPRPIVTISPDTLVCAGAPVYLLASGGSGYLWSPASTLNNATIPDPVSNVQTSTVYKVTVSDTLGCPKKTTATVRISVYRALYAIAERDTMVVMGEPVQLNGYGGLYYHWTPSLYLNDPGIANPIARPFDDITYVLKISNNDNCIDSAIVHIRAFRDPDIYAPSAFTPNNDGLNDVFRVFPVGFILKELKVYDRWGNIVFVTNDETKGWDGKLKGQPQATATFVWTASGKNKKTGASVTKKGQVTLIR